MDWIGWSSRESSPALNRDEYLDAWARLHGTDPRATALVRLWLGLSYRVARPLASWRVPPDALTLLGVLFALAAPLVAAAGGHWPVAAAAVVTLSGFADNLDGAVAVVSGRVTRWGAALDALCDRVADGAGYLALWVVGADPWLVVAAAVLAYLHEYLRARAAALGQSDVAVITVSERPTRVIVVAMFLLGAGLYPLSADRWGSAGAGVSAVLGLFALLQLVFAVRRRLR
ncbi:CDP-alcohol phosphatidyltransferase family protein [Angustibacter sp. McL0619]|uniref:CDP-alcohol phosphatidyltransferase family protein n=1 Tax=Angustibacter sp. McL0619 TaxID=3415676 RepID=UPI003CEC5E12